MAVKAVGKQVGISAKRLRPLLHALRGRPVQEALATLRFPPGPTAASLAAVPRPAPGPDATCVDVRSTVGGAGIMDGLVGVGSYHTLAHSLQALEVELPDGAASALTYRP